MNEEITSAKVSENKIAAYLFLRDPGVNSFEELEQFKLDFPDVSSSIIVWTFARLFYEKHGVRIFGF